MFLKFNKENKMKNRTKYMLFKLWILIIFIPTMFLGVFFGWLYFIITGKKAIETFIEYVDRKEEYFEDLIEKDNANKNRGK